MTITDTDLTVIDHLDFAPPCEVVPAPVSAEGHCPREAEWIVSYIHHCLEDIRTIMVCDKDYREACRPGFTVLCGGCGDITTTMSKRIISAVRI